jgi:tetratricopeptide (TPR) repeat protein
MNPKHKPLVWLASSVLAFSGLNVMAQNTNVSQGKSLFGEEMYTNSPNPVNVAPTDKLIRATAEAKAAYEANPTIDTTTWYGRVLSYQGLMREAIQVYTAGLKKYPESAKLLRHRAHRYFNLREFDKSIADGLRSAALYKNKPLEREKLGPEYFPSTPDVVQFYLYYHLGHAYLAKHDFDAAAKWFGHARETGIGVGEVTSITAATYWEYLSLARGGRYDDANKLLAGYNYTLVDLMDNLESNNYFDGIQLFKHMRDPNTFFDDKDTGKAFSTSDSIIASTSYSLSTYYLLRGETDKAKDHLRRATKINTWSFFARVQAEADWVYLFGKEKP